MITLRVEDMGDHVGYVIMDKHGDIANFKSRKDAEDAIKVAGMEPGDAVSFGIQLAADFALNKHGSQEHGSLTMAEHLRIVSALVENYCDYPAASIERLNIVSAAWLHDIIEDTDITREMLLEHFEEEVADLVWAVTDRPGANRYQRHLDTYWRIREKGGDAVLIKLCDRMHNQARSLAFSECYLKMYVEEYGYFKVALWRPGEHAKIWSLLDAQFAKMKEALDGEELRERERLGGHTRAGTTPHGAEQSPCQGAA